MLKIFKHYFVLLLWISLPGAALAAGDAAGGLNVQINFENDAFYDKDYHYTNGLQVRFITPKLLEFAIGQHIYTPEYKKYKELQKHDRPYAGYLYGVLAKHRQNDNRLDTLELAAGIIGPSAQGEAVQNSFHRMIKANKSRGWEHQLKDEPTLMLTLARIWSLNRENAANGGWSWDILPRIAASAGTPFTLAALGAQARFGWNLPNDFSSTYMRPGSGVYLPSDANSFSLCFFSGLEGRILIWNSFLDGNLWRNSHSVDKKYFVAEFSSGLMAAYKDWRGAYTHIYRGKEFDGQNKAQNYSSVMLGYVF